MTRAFLSMAGCVLADNCNVCHKRKAMIYYAFGTNSGYRAFCEFCCEHMALGMLRDLAEVQYGKEKADKWYRQLHTLKEIRNQEVRQCLRESLHESINAVIDNSMKKPDEEYYGAPLKRLTSTAMLHERLADLAGMTVKQLAKKIDLKSITLEGGPGIQFVTISKK